MKQITEKGFEYHTYCGVLILRLHNRLYTWGHGETTLEKCKEEIQNEIW